MTAKTKKFKIPSDNMVGFASELSDLGLSNEITGVDDDDNIIVEVSYDSNERNELFELMAWYDDNVEEQDEE